MSDEHAQQHSRQQGQRRLGQQTEVEIKQVARSATRSGRFRAGSTQTLFGVYLQDIEEMALRFFDQLDVLGSLELPCPATVDSGGRNTPLDVYNSALPVNIRNNRGTLRSEPLSRVRILLSEAKNYATLAGFNVLDLPRDVARQNFEHGLEEFIIHRTKSARGFNGVPGGVTPGTASVPGLNIIVNTLNSNLHILYSPAFFPAIQTPLGNMLSTPVTGNIGPGIYIFGAQGGAIGTKFETNLQYPIPPTTVVNMRSV